MGDFTKAVFLSYAHEDAAAATRIAEALRGFGVEVWFDQNELRGGDQWDQKIRGQIKACALFLPVISATTQSRDEAYFRLEWKLADDRSHLMAPGKVFIVPVVIDATSEAGAAVPDSFNRAQWTRLAGGVPSTAFIEQVKRLLGTPAKPAPVGRVSDPPSDHASREKAKAGHRPALPRTSRWPVILGAIAVVAVGYFGWQNTRPAKSTSTATLSSSAPNLPPPASSLSPTAAAAPAKSTPADKSIAVLPFANLSPDAENAFFADGMHDDLITALAKIRDLKVISRTSVKPYKTGARNLRKIAEELGVATVLEGSVQRAGNRVRLNIQLIDARTDAHLWAETYNKELTDVFTIQAALTQEISTALKASLTGAERALIARRPTENQAAYELYLRARILDQNIQINSSRAETERVLELYDQAIALDPGFALAHAYAGILHGYMFWFAALDPTPARRARALASLEAAQRLAPGSPEVVMAEGAFEYSCNNDWAKALARFQAAEASLPNDSQLHYRLAVTHRRLGDFKAALARLERSAELNPNDARGTFTLVETAQYLRRYPQVVALAERYRSVGAGDHDIHWFRVEAQFQIDGNLEAYRQGWTALPARGNDPLGLEREYERAMTFGDLAAAERTLDDSRLPTIRGLGGVVNEPAALHRAQIAWLQGREEDARRWAESAITHYRGRTWGIRQQPVVQLDIARAEALAGRKEIALREARAAMAAQLKMDAMTAANLRFVMGGVLVVCGEREEALALLREHMGTIGRETPIRIRRDPFWSRLKDDPRFEEILKSVKPL